ncbi:MAG: hypothetical protein PVF15_09635 [Candidatus Bathyarchaeota archaeon]
MVVNEFLDRAKVKDEIENFLQHLVESKKISTEDAQLILKGCYTNLVDWLVSKNISTITKEGIKTAIKNERWADLVEAFWQNIVFGTGGIRNKAVLSEKELKVLGECGLNAVILKGSNLINDVVFVKSTIGVANYMDRHKMRKVVIGYDSRLQGKTFAELIARVFLSRKFQVYLFDEACPVPELSFAVTNLGADIGIEISASHNDKRCNGYKITNKTGAGLNLDERQEIIDEIYGNEKKGIKGAQVENLDLVELDEAEENMLTYLGGEFPIVEIGGRPFINMHERHLDHVKKFISNKSVVKKLASKVEIGYCAYYGAGYKAVPRLLKELGFTNVKIISEFNKLDGYFPAFKLTQLPDPGDPRAAEIAVKRFKEEYGEKAFENLDILIGTDPDSDRMGVVVKIPENQQEILGDWKLLSADDAWTLLLGYQLQTEADKHGGILPEVNKKFIVKNHVTTDALSAVAAKYGVSCINTWVGFAMLADRIIRERQKGKVNVGAFESSNGYSIGGAKPDIGEFLGRGGHTLEKDGTLAALLIAEIAAYAKSIGSSIVELLDSLYLDPEIGYYATAQWQLPEEGVFEGVEGEWLKRRLIRNVERIKNEANERSDSTNPLQIAGLHIVRAEKFATGKYDNLYWLGFPDEGIRFHFDRTGMNHITIRPSGTEAKLRFYVQHKIHDVDKNNLAQKKLEGEKLTWKIIRGAMQYVTYYSTTGLA